jgi:DNA repair protein RadC
MQSAKDCVEPDLERNSETANNHPSGDAFGCRHRVDENHRERREALGVALHDHIIVGKDAHASRKRLRLI